MTFFVLVDSSDSSLTDELLSDMPKLVPVASLSSKHQQKIENNENQQNSNKPELGAGGQGGLQKGAPGQPLQQKIDSQQQKSGLVSKSSIMEMKGQQKNDNLAQKILSGGPSLSGLQQKPNTKPSHPHSHPHAGGASDQKNIPGGTPMELEDNGTDFGFIINGPVIPANGELTDSKEKKLVSELSPLDQFRREQLRIDANKRIRMDIMQLIRQPDRPKPPAPRPHGGPAGGAAAGAPGGQGGVTRPSYPEIMKLLNQVVGPPDYHE